MGKTMQHPRPWLLPRPQRIILALLSGLSGKHEQDKVGHDGQGYAQDHADHQPEQAPSSHRLNAFPGMGHYRETNLHLERDLFQDRFKVANDSRLSFQAYLLQRAPANHGDKPRCPCSKRESPFFSKR